MQLSALSLAITRLGRVPAYSPIALFTGTTTGAWYDPSDTTTLFRDTAGTLPVTAMEQPVGLMLDKSKGLVLGPELVTNGDFATDTAWAKGSNWSIADSAATHTIGVAGAIQQTISLSAGKRYLVTVTASSMSGSGGCSVNFGVTEFGLITANGSYTYRILTSSGDTKIFFYAGSTQAITLDNISVRELPGNHAFNSSGNSADFPVLSARVNLLTKSEQLHDTGVWSRDGGVTVTADQATAPDGTMTADLMSGTSSSGIIQATTQPSNVQAVVRMSVRGGTGNQIRVRAVSAATANFCQVDFNTSTEAISASNNGTASGATATFTKQLVGSDTWYNITLTGTPQAAAGNTVSFYIWGVTGTFYLWGADLRVANDALNQPAYQRVNTATDYDTVGFKPYLKFNGTNQWLQTNSIDFTYGDKMFVSAGVRKLSDAAAGVLIETNGGGSPTYAMYTPAGNTANYGIRSRGTLGGAVATTSSVFPAPITNVVSLKGSIPDDVAIVRVNGSDAGSLSGDQGTGNYGNYPMFVGARAGTSLWFNGRLYQMVVAGKQASATEITSTETYINTKTGAF